jgi:CelD/BcsL family acetyltransferase involved in cellulose biosynthesis
MHIRVVDTTEEFESLREDWNTLLECADGASVFVSWEWTYNWWRHYGKKHSLRILAAWEHGRLTGLLPLYIQRTVVYRYYPVNVLRFIGTGGDTAPDYLGPLLVPVVAERTASAFIEYVLDEVSGWDVLHLSDLGLDSVLWAQVKRQCAARRYELTPSVAARIAYITLPSSWENYLASVHRDRRYTIRSTRRKFETQHQGRFYVRASEDGIDEVIDRLIELHHRRWQAKSEQHAFSSDEYIGFHRDVIHACARRGWIRFYWLEANGLPLAVFYCYRFRNHIYYFQAGFNPDYERLRPGLVLIGYAVEHAIQEGNIVFDFLRGEHEYKSQWGKSMRETHALTVYRGGLSAALYRMREETIPSVKRWIKRLFPYVHPHRHGRDRGHGAVEQQKNA